MTLTNTPTGRLARVGEHSLPEGARLLATIGADVAAPLQTAKVYRVPAYLGYRFLVRFFKDGQRHLTRADYEADDLGDATGTAKHAIRRCYRHSPASVPPSARLEG